MTKKSFILSSSGLQNIILDQLNDANDFNFIFGEQKLKMNKVFAEFLSPRVSQLHQSDPTICSINIQSIFNRNSSTNPFNNKDFFTEDILSIIQQISIGASVNISEDQSLKIRIISIILGNEELYKKINELFPKVINMNNINQILQELLNFYYYLPESHNYDYSRYIDFISGHFYEIDKKDLINLPKSILYAIISNKNLVIENEDSLLDFIYDIFPDQEYDDQYDDEEEDEEEYFNINKFYEKVEFISLSEEKFRYFLKVFDSNEITNEIWKHLCHCFYTNYQSSKKVNVHRYSQFTNYLIKDIVYDNNTDHSFQGIINYLTKLSGGNVSDNGTVEVSSSSINSHFYPKYAVDFDDKKHYFQSTDQEGAWIKFDFKGRKIHPTHYSIRTRSDWSKGGGHLKNWTIEGSNTNKNNDWKVLDSRKDITCLDDSYAMSTFDITTLLEPNEFFRYLRLKITGFNTDNKNYLFLSALEFFGSLLEAAQ